MAWDVIIVGSGVIGLFHAYHARIRGLKTLLVERNSTPSQASVRNFGMIIPSAMAPGIWRTRALASAELYQTLAQRWDLPIQTGGTLYLATTPGEQAVLEEFAQFAPGYGCRCRLLSTQEAVKLCPQLHPTQIQAALLAKEDLRIESAPFLRALLNRFQTDLRLTVQTNSVVVRVEVDSGEFPCQTMLGDGQRLRSRHVFICNGADVRTLFADQFAKSPLIACKLQMMRTEPQSQTTWPQSGVSLASGLSVRRYDAFQQVPSWKKLDQEPLDPNLNRWGIHVLMATNADGTITIGDSHEYQPITKDFDDRLNTQIENLILHEANRLLAPGWNSTIAERWHGVYLIDPNQDVWTQTISDRIKIITGLAGKGMTVGPELARESWTEFHS